MRSPIAPLCILFAAAMPTRADTNIDTKSFDATVDTIQIQQIINHFPLTVDNHDYQALRALFTADAFADLGYTGFESLHGIDAIITALSLLANISSQHDLSTSVVNLTRPSAANATMYLVGNFFGQGNQAGQKFSTWGRYLLVA